MTSTFTFDSLGVTAIAPTTTTVGTGGIVPISAPSGFANWPITTATSGTDVTGINGTQFVSSLWLPVSMTLTGVSFLVGSVGGTNVAVVVLYDSTGAVLANSSLAGSPKGTTVGTAAQIQALPFTATYAAKGPGLFYVGVSYSGNTAKIRCVPAFTQGGIWGGSVTQTQGVPAAITPPTTFTADLAPVCFLY